MNKNEMYYNYAVKQFLVRDIFEYRDINRYANVYLSIYKINTSGKYPFLQFLLTNNGLNLLSLPKLPVFNFSTEKLISYSKIYISGIFEIQNFQNLIENIEFDGFYEYENNLYMFFDTTNLDICIREEYSNNPVRFALVDEIINHKKVCNIPISLETVNFFTKNESINYLFDINNDTYEIPLVGFIGKKTPQQLNFTFIFGESPRDKLSIFGSNYYFTDFNNAVRQGGWSNDYKPEYLYDKLITDNENGRYIKGGLVRFALFMGKTKYIENNLDSLNDQSVIKKDKLNDSTLNKKYEILTLRISDHDSIWRNDYDSIYLGNLEMDDGSYIQEHPVIVLKDYNQQLSLSYHFINKSCLGDKFNPCCDYMIV
jgi:hypothetical protein